MLRLLAFLAVLASPLRAEAPRVVTDIAPVHALVATVMQGVGAPELIVPQGANVHHHAMRPSEARALSEAGVVVWIGPGLAPWLEDAIDNLGADAQVITLMETPGVHLLPFREGAMFETGDHDHDHGHGDEEASDPHVWLDPDNGSLFLSVIAEALSQADPANAAIYASNAAEGQAALAAVTGQIEAKLAAARGVPFIVLHDGFHYFEDRFGVEAIGAISDSDAQTPGAKRVAQLRAALSESPLACAFSEPQVGTRMVETVTEGLDVRLAVLDPLGMELPLGAELYTALLTSMGDSMAGCLTP